MKHFRKIGDVDIAPVMDRLAALRLHEPHDGDIVVEGFKHKAVPLRIHDEYLSRPVSFFEDLPVRDLPLLDGWPEMRVLLQTCRAMVMADPVIGPTVVDELGRVVFSIIEPHGFITEHCDTGAYIDATFRFHLPVFTHPAAVNYEMDGESLHIDFGELTWINNRDRHWATNPSPVFRNHLIFELRCRTN